MVFSEKVKDAAKSDEYGLCRFISKHQNLICLIIERKICNGAAIANLYRKSGEVMYINADIAYALQKWRAMLSEPHVHYRQRG